MNKIIDGARHALEVAKCDHNLIVQPRQRTASVEPSLERYYCTKCRATFWVPIKDAHRFHVNNHDLA